jgi:hypothetical protein
MLKVESKWFQSLKAASIGDDTTGRHVRVGRQLVGQPAAARCQTTHPYIPD